MTTTMMTTTAMTTTMEDGHSKDGLTLPTRQKIKVRTSLWAPCGVGALIRAESSRTAPKRIARFATVPSSGQTEHVH